MAAIFLSSHTPRMDLFIARLQAKNEVLEVGLTKLVVFFRKKCLWEKLGGRGLRK
jgi:hypothetical protein